jgi:hypothetical protein
MFVSVMMQLKLISLSTQPPSIAKYVQTFILDAQTVSKIQVISILFVILALIPHFLIMINALFALKHVVHVQVKLFVMYVLVHYH